MSEKGYKADIKSLNGNEAVAHSVHSVGVDLIPIYPITPQTEIGEFLSAFEKEKVIEMESEHSVMMFALGVSLAGGRTFTATSSQGLLYMSECLPYVSGARAPIVMAVSNRVFALPWSIESDFSDSFYERDSGWLQICCKNAQEVYDYIIKAYRIAESVNLPVMINLEGFYLSHTKERVETNAIEDIKKFVGKYNPKYKLDVTKPYTFAGQGLGENYAKFKHIMSTAMEKSEDIIKTVSKDYSKKFGRTQSDLIEVKKPESKNYIVCYGYISNLIECLISNLKDWGMIRVVSFRPFPQSEIQRALHKTENVVVIDNTYSVGGGGVVFKEIDGLIGTKKSSIIAGVGGETVSLNKLKFFIEKCAKHSPIKEVWYQDV